MATIVTQFCDEKGYPNFHVWNLAAIDTLGCIGGGIPDGN